MKLDLGTLLMIAQRAQETIGEAMNAAFGTALVRVSIVREDHSAPLDESILPTFEKAFAQIVLPVFEIIYEKHENQKDLHRFVLGQVKEKAIEDNHAFFMQRAHDLIEDSRQRAEYLSRHQSAPFN